MRKKPPVFKLIDGLEKASSDSSFRQVVEHDWKDFLLPNFHPKMQDDLPQNPWRVTIFLSLTLILFAAIFFKLFHLQVVNGQANRELADGNRIQVKVIYAPRGLILDRNGKILASNYPGFRLFDPKTQTVTFIGREDALEMEVTGDREYKLEVDSIRTYAQGEEMAHILGYVGEISKEQLSGSAYSGYVIGDRVGQTGIEAVYELALRGTNGGEIIEVDAQGRTVRTLRKTAPILGNNVYLTIDSDLQKLASGLLKKTLSEVGSCCGSVIVATLSGEILALVSLPSYDNNIFTSPTPEGLDELLSRPDSPILNRAISGTYPPGSTFKIVSSLAALGSGKITPKTVFEDSGQVFLGPYRFTNWYFTQYGKTEGQVDLAKALKRSNDTYFYLVGEKIGEQAIIDWSKKLKLGSRLGIDLPAEASGLIPDHQWKIENTSQPWYPGDTLHMAIGQGFILTTPLQILGVTSFVANNGKLFQPQLLLKVTDSREQVVAKLEPKVIAEERINPQYLTTVRQGLEEATKEGGTAWPLFTFPVPTAGKTGTAEYGDPKGKTHAWYTAYAPSQDPKIVATVLVEGGGEGSSIAAPIAKEIFRWYLSEDKNNLIKDTYQYE